MDLIQYVPTEQAVTAARAKKGAAPRRREEARVLFRNAILESAEEVFAERGFHGARIQDIATRARLAVGTVYNHFGQKEDVMRALLEERIEQLLLELAPAPGDPRPFEANLAARLGRMITYTTRHRGFFTLASEHGLMGSASGAAREFLGPRPLRHVERFRRALREIAEQGVLAGALRPLDFDVMARFLGGALRAVLQVGEDERGAPEEEARLVVSLFLHGAQRKKTNRTASA
jgi:AcrR family transcriptional regulator